MLHTVQQFRSYMHAPLNNRLHVSSGELLTLNIEVASIFCEEHTHKRVLVPKDKIIYIFPYPPKNGAKDGRPKRIPWRTASADVMDGKRGDPSKLVTWQQSKRRKVLVLVHHMKMCRLSSSSTPQQVHLSSGRMFFLYRFPRVFNMFLKSEP